VDKLVTTNGGFMFKKFFAVLTLVSVFNLGFAYADCEPMYKSYKVKAAVKSGLSTTGGAGLVALGAYAAVVGSVAGVFASNEGFIILGLIAGGLSAANGVVLTVSSVKNATRFVGYFKALKLVRESKLGTGEHLEELAEDLNEKHDLSGDNQVTTLQLATLINEGNETKAFCMDKKSLYTKKTMVQWLESKLGF